jgi:hypothetical protein
VAQRQVAAAPGVWEEAPRAARVVVQAVQAVQAVPVVVPVVVPVAAAVKVVAQRRVARRRLPLLPSGQ